MPIKDVLCRCSSIALLIVVAGCNQQPPDNRAADESTIRNLDAQWSKAAATHDLDGVLSFYSDDAIVLPQNAPAVTGKQAIRALWADLAGPDVSLSWQATKVEVAKSGDLAYSIDTYADTWKDPQGKLISDKGKIMEIWKKQPDGRWKVAADMYNSDLPPQP